MRSSSVLSGPRRSGAKRRYRKGAKATSVSTAVKKYVRSAVPRVEIKQQWQHDNEVQLNTLTQGAMQGYPQVINALAATGRIGSDISLLSVDIKGCLYNNSGAESYVRMLMVGHPGSIDPTFSTFPLFLTAGSGSTGTVSTVTGLDIMYYPINTTELTVYEDKVFRLAGSATAGGPSNTQFFHKIKSFGPRGKKITYKANSSGPNNQNWFVSVIWLVSDANDDTTAGTAVELSQLTRISYSDC